MNCPHPTNLYDAIEYATCVLAFVVLVWVLCKYLE